MKVLQFPLVRVTLFFVFGILFAQITKPKLHLISLLLIIAIVLVILNYFFSKKLPILKSFFGIITFLTSFLIGVFTLVSAVQTNNSNHYIHQLDAIKKDNSIEILIKEKLKTTTTNNRYVAQIHTLNGKKSYGKLLVNIAKESSLHPIEIGTSLKIKGVIYLNKSHTQTHPK